MSASADHAFKVDGKIWQIRTPGTHADLLQHKMFKYSNIYPQLNLDGDDFPGTAKKLRLQRDTKVYGSHSVLPTSD